MNYLLPLFLDIVAEPDLSDVAAASAPILLIFCIIGGLVLGVAAVTALILFLVFKKKKK